MNSRNSSKDRRRGSGPRKTRNDASSLDDGESKEALSPGTLSGPLTSAQRKHLRGLGHRLKPIILVGKEGVSPGLIARVREELVIHELIKVKVLQNSPMDKEEAGPLLVDGSGATLVATIGKTFLLYAPHPLEPVIRLPRVRDQRGE